MTETCASCGKVFLPKPGEPACPHCKAEPADKAVAMAPGADQSWDNIDGGWDLDDEPAGADSDSEPEPEPEPERAVVATPGPISGEVTTAQIRRPHRTRAKGKKRRQSSTAPAQQRASRPRKKKPRPRAEHAETKHNEKKKPKPAWLWPLVAMLIALGLFALILMAKQAK